MEQAEGYSEDCYSTEAVALIKRRIGRADADIHLLAGGTQTNLTALAAFLRPHEAAVAATTGHILVHETGAIEATGHKIIPVDVPDGKLTPGQIWPVLESHSDEHMVKPRLVYISNSTEIGSIYTKQELELLGSFCRTNNLLLYLDGARLGPALCSEENDLKLADLAALVDAFYIGGTKNGAIIGEALVICNPALEKDFRFIMKQRGAMLAKGRLIGLQFAELFRDDLYFELARHANAMAGLLKDGIRAAGYGFLTDSSTNQIFPILPLPLIEKLREKYSFYTWSKVDEENSSVRLVTSWATRPTAVEEFINDLKKY